MQGNEKKSTNIDQQFQDHSWNEMQKMLDAEMPQVKADRRGKKRYLLLLLILFLGFGSGAGTMYYLNQQEIENTETEHKKDIATFENLKINEDKVTAENSQLNLKSISKKNDEVKEEIIVSEKNTIANAKFEINTKTQTIDHSISDAQEPIIEKEANLAERNEVILSPNNLETREEIRSTPTESFAFLPTKYQLLEVDENDFKIPKINTSKKKKWSFGLLLGNYSNQNRVLAGIALGGKAVYDIDSRFSIGGGLQYSIISGFQKKSKNNADRLAADTPASLPSDNNNPDDTTSVTTGVESFSNNNYQVFSTDELPISSLHYLEMPIELAYRFNEKFQINLGVKAGYLLKAKYNGSLNNNFSSRAQADNSLENNLAQFDFSTSLGFGFYPTEKFGFDLRYNHGWVDVTPDKIWPQNQIDANKNIQLSMLYFFGK